MHAYLLFKYFMKLEIFFFFFFFLFIFMKKDEQSLFYLILKSLNDNAKEKYEPFFIIKKIKMLLFI